MNLMIHLIGIVGVGTLIGFIVKAVRAFHTTNIEKIYMSPSSLVLNRFVNTILYGLFILVVSLLTSIYFEGGNDFWKDGGKAPVYLVWFTFLLLISVGVSVWSVAIYGFKKKEWIRKIVFWSSNSLILFTTLTAILGFIGMYYLIYSHYLKEIKALKKGLEEGETINLLAIDFPMEYLSGILFIFFILCALTYLSYTAVRSVIDIKPLLSHIRKDDELFKNGMIFLYSINEDKQVVLPFLEGTEEYTRDTYPQYIYSPNSDTIVKYDINYPPKKTISKEKNDFNPKINKIQKWFKRK